MNIIGRKKEQQILQDCLDSNKSEFLVVYGRRRVGKTFMIKEFFDNRFSFYATGVENVNMKNELSFFYDSLIEYGSADKSPIKTWREAFSRLKSLLKNDSVARDPLSGKRIIFLDELPWMDTPRSDFKPSLDHFWNSYASAEKDIVLIVCGSATSWIIGNILTDRGGFYNRITRQIHLMPFTLGECERFFMANELKISREDIVSAYMIFGGIPYYLGLFSRRMSLAQNVDALVFDESGPLHYEYKRLFNSLFKNSEKHYQIIETLAKRRSGLMRTEIINDTGIADGTLLTKALSELEQCGFIRKYINFAKSKTCAYFQIIDPFVLFSITFTENKKLSSWTKYIRTPSYNSWSGLAYELVCLNHVDKIKNALGISGVESSEYAWRSEHSSPGAY